MVKVSGLRHEALLYADGAEYLGSVGSFIRDGLDADLPVFVAVPAKRGEQLKNELDGDAHRVKFADMTQLGRNPSTIIPAVRAFMHEYGQPFRFVGEPIWRGRTADEIAEATRHESLINLAFAETTAHILCPYNIQGLHAATVADAHRTHPDLVTGNGQVTSQQYKDPAVVCHAGAWPLPAVPAHVEIIESTITRLADIRRLVREHARAVGLSDTRIDDFVLAVDELCTNTMKYSPSIGTLRMWQERDELVCEVRDAGRILDLLVGRRQVPPGAMHGRGLFLVNHLCDLVQLRSSELGTTIRLRIRL